MEKIFQVQTTELVTELHKLQFDTDARANLLTYLISTNSNHSDAFREYEQEYIQFYHEYIIAKTKFEKEIIRPYLEENNIPVTASWKLDFEDNRVTITW